MFWNGASFGMPKGRFVVIKHHFGKGIAVPISAFYREIGFLSIKITSYIVEFVTIESQKVENFLISSSNMTFRGFSMPCCHPIMNVVDTVTPLNSVLDQQI